MGFLVSVVLLRSLTMLFDFSVILIGPLDAQIYY